MRKKWKTIEGYNYEISNYGEVRNKKTKYRLKIWYVNKNRHARVNLSKDGIDKSFGVARLVITHFPENDIPKEVVSHLDFNNANNRRPNLKWATRSENMRRLRSEKNKLRGVLPWKYGKKTWRAYITDKKSKTKTVGYYNTHTEAVVAMHNAYLELNGFAPFRLQDFT